MASLGIRLASQSGDAFLAFQHEQLAYAHCFFNDGYRSCHFLSFATFAFGTEFNMFLLRPVLSA
jgi:hypothetical protein